MVSTSAPVTVRELNLFAVLVPVVLLLCTLRWYSSACDSPCIPGGVIVVEFACALDRVVLVPCGLIISC